MIRSIYSFQYARLKIDDRDCSVEDNVDCIRWSADFGIEWLDNDLFGLNDYVSDKMVDAIK